VWECVRNLDSGCKRSRNFRVASHKSWHFFCGAIFASVSRVYGEVGKKWKNTVVCVTGILRLRAPIGLEKINEIEVN